MSATLGSVEIVMAEDTTKEEAKWLRSRQTTKRIKLQKKMGKR